MLGDTLTDLFTIEVRYSNSSLPVDTDLVMTETCRIHVLRTNADWAAPMPSIPDRESDSVAYRLAKYMKTAAYQQHGQETYINHDSRKKILLHDAEPVGDLHDSADIGLLSAPDWARTQHNAVYHMNSREADVTKDQSSASDAARQI